MSINQTKMSLKFSLIFFTFIILFIITNIIVSKNNLSFNSNLEYPKKWEEVKNISSKNLKCNSICENNASFTSLKGYETFKNSKFNLAHNQLLFWALNGNTRSQFVQGFLYEFGLGVKQDFKKSSFWYIKTINLNSYNIKSLNRAIKFYFGLDGFEQNYKEAAKWFRFAGELSFDSY